MAAHNHPYVLCIDDRERYVAQYIDAHNVPYKIMRLEIGDFRITSEDGRRVHAVIERKTLADQAASIRDGRRENKQKMIDLRSRVGCDVFYLFEGQRRYPDTYSINGVPYGTIAHSMMNLMVRDKVFVIHALDEADTVREMVELLRTYDRIHTELGHTAPMCPTITQTAHTDDAGADDSKITEEIKDMKTLRAMWCNIPGVNKVSCELFKQYRLIDLFVRDAQIAQHVPTIRYASGRKLAQSTIDELTNISAPTMLRIISTTRGITPEAAQTVLAAMPDWSKCTKEALSSIKHNNKKLGKYGMKLYALLHSKLCRGLPR